MNTKSNDQHPPIRQTDTEESNPLPGYPAYPESEDIYFNYLEEPDIDPEDISKTKVSNEPNGQGTKGFLDDISISDLDIPGSEFDDNQEDIGSEDEENNYYSLGGDEHNDLEEDQGD